MAFPRILLIAQTLDPAQSPGSAKDVIEGEKPPGKRVSLNQRLMTPKTEPRTTARYYLLVKAH